ncbi:hypothetical protein EPUL_002222 [Erysiphe pulchra]|uniref:Uncharacterized protein n=1 Tax=Erysiphe pulchra TaxID=225359 RepID=A0A2S4PV47_9PEZI|nr:hypothetical protein EPUL_002222 [Erysiphe pulchra]
MAKGSTASTQQHLDITSDHLPLLVTVFFDFQRTRTEPKLRFAHLNENICYSLLKINIDMTSLEQKSPSSVDKRAEEQVDALRNSFAGLAKRSLFHNTGKP